jgi:hypothetical protein
VNHVVATMAAAPLQPVYAQRRFGIEFLAALGGD